MQRIPASMGREKIMAVLDPDPTVQRQLEARLFQGAFRVHQRSHDDTFIGRRLGELEPVLETTELQVTTQFRERIERQALCTRSEFAVRTHDLDRGSSTA